jgi:hypothetical protein
MPGDSGPSASSPGSFFVFAARAPWSGCKPTPAILFPAIRKLSPEFHRTESIVRNLV